MELDIVKKIIAFFMIFSIVIFCAYCKLNFNELYKGDRLLFYYDEHDGQVQFNDIINSIGKLKTVKEYKRNATIDEMDTVKFGKFEQDNDVNNGKEDIEWIILERHGNKILLLSKYILDCRQFHEDIYTHPTKAFDNIPGMAESRIKIEKEIAEQIKNSTFDTSALKRWLNSDFIWDSFTIWECMRIVPMDYDKSLCSLLDIYQCKEYFGNIDSSGFNYRLATRGTPYALSKGLNVSTKKNLWYSNNSSFWLLDNGITDDGYNLNKACFVGTFGKIYESGDDISLEHGDGVRPMLWVDIEYSKKMTSAKFGRYEQDDNLDNGKEQIDWWVIDDILDGNKHSVLLLSKNILDAKKYNELEGSVTWENCSLRKWLNTKFYNQTFNSQERQQILDFRNEHIDYDNLKNTKDTKDKVFLLGYNELEKYFFGSMKSRTSKKTNYVNKINNYDSYNKYVDNSSWEYNNGGYWTREGRIDRTKFGFWYRYEAITVNARGGLNTEFKSKLCGVRPAIWIQY